jgi:hypothetical protein
MAIIAGEWKEAVMAYFKALLVLCTWWFEFVAVLKCILIFLYTHENSHPL